MHKYNIQFSRILNWAVFKIKYFVEKICDEIYFLNQIHIV